jgi:hypothetical protein
MSARDELDLIKARNRYTASSTRQERAQYREDHARLTAAVEAALARADRWESIAGARDLDNLVETDADLRAENNTRAITLYSNVNSLRTAIKNALESK